MLAVVIPTLDDEEPLALTLAALVPAAADGTVREVIVVDGGSSDHTLRVADVTGCTIVRQKGPVSVRLHAGAAAASRGEWLLFLTPGVVLDARWEVEVSAFIERVTRAGQAGAVAAVFRHALDDVTAGARTREFATGLGTWITGLPTRAQGFLISREHYRRIGGFKPMEAMEEVDLALRIGRGRLVRLRSRASVARTREGGVPFGAVRRSLSRGLAALRVPLGLLTRLHG